MKKILIALAMVCMAAMPSVAQGNGNKDAKPTKEQVAQRSAMRYDRGGDAMYDAASALRRA